MQVIYLPKAHTFIADLDSLLAARTKKMLDLLRNHGHELRMPFSKPIKDGIFELRVAGAVQIRLLYFFHKGDAVIVHALTKKTEQLSRKDIEYALRVRKTFIANS